MIRIYQEFETEAEAEKYRDGVYRAYSPMGYSTHIVISFDERLKRWVAYGGRAESCD